jgi:hypothetical protein
MAPLDFNAATAAEAGEIKRRKAAITRRIRKQVLAELGIDRLPKRGERTLITGAQGTGKSRTCAETIATLPGAGLSFWWLVPSLEKAEEQVREYNRIRFTDSLLGRVVRGRGALDPRTVDGDAMCPRHKVVNRAAAMGMNVQQAICDNGCARRFSCGFQRQARTLREDPTGLFVMASDYLWLPCPAPRPDVVIVDESVVDKATDTVSFDPSRIVADELWAGGPLEEAMGRRCLALLVRAAVVEHPGRELAFLRERDVTVEAVREALSHLAAREEAQPVLDGTMTDQEIANVLDAVEAREILKVLRLFRQIRIELPQRRSRLSTVWFDSDARVMVDGEIERQPRVFVSAVRTLSQRLTKETPVLALDGTGSIDLNRRIFGERMTCERFAVPRNAEVWQVTSKAFSRQSITGTDRRGDPISPKKTSEAARLRRQVLDLLKMLPGKVLLVTYKQAEEILRPDLPPNVHTAHFGALRGLNAYEHCETAVVMGREQPSPQAIEALTRPFCATDAEPFIPIGEYVLQSRGRRMRNGGPNVAELQVHPDTRCQAMLEQVREGEIAQAIDRVRPVFNRRRIVVLTKVALDLTVDHALTWPELRPGKFAYAFARHGVLPLSAGDLCRAFPTLWPTAKEAENAVAYLDKNTLKTPNEDSIWSIQGIFADLLRASYRRKGQRGRSARALIAAALPDPRAVLERLVGELTEFHLDRAARSPAEAGAPEPERSMRPLPPLAAALSAEAHLLATLPPDERPPDMLGMARVIKLMTLAGEHGGPERAAA